MQKKDLLEIKNLVVRYETDDGVVKALNDVSLRLCEGRTLGVVGETGAGKTTLARSILQLVPTPPGRILSGEINFLGRDLLKLTKQQMRDVRGREISMIFQDPMTSLNPVMLVGEQIMEVIKSHNPRLSKQEARNQAGRMLEMVGIPSSRAMEYPHQFSGGMKQRVIIAIALACNPKLLIADEPTTALDVTIQAQVLDMIRELKQQLGTSIILITHDLGVVAQNCDDVAILYAGEVIEQGSLREVFHHHQHPYTKGLFHSIPSLATKVDRLRPIRGLMPDPTDLPEGCKFAARCDQADAQCHQQMPPFVSLSPTHQVRCIKVGQGGQ